LGGAFPSGSYGSTLIGPRKRSLNFLAASFLRDDGWKLTSSGELYDLTRDPDELRPIGLG
jgi:hypothetical protein